MINLFQIRHLFLCMLLTSCVACTSVTTKPTPESDEVSSETTGETPDAETAAAEEETEKEPEKPEKKTDISQALLYKLLIAELAAKEGDSETAIENYLAAARATGDVDAASRAAEIANRSRNYPKMLEAVQLWVELDDKSPIAYRAYAITLLQMNRPAHAVDQFDKMVALMPDDQLRAFEIISDRLVHMPDFEVGKAVMEQVVEKHKNSPEAQYAYGYLLMRLAKFDLAVKAFDRALALKKDWTRAILLRASTLSLNKQRKQAVAYLAETVDRLPKNIEVGMAYVKMLAEDERTQDALDFTKKLLELAPRNAELFYTAAILALQVKDIDSAETYFKRVLKLGKRLQIANYYLGQIAEEKKDFNTAINRYSTVRHGELYFRSQVRVAMILADTGKLDRAREYIRTIRAEGSKQKLNLMILEGRLLAEAKLYQEAKDYYTKLLQQNPNESSIRYERGIIAEKLGDLALAESDFQEILKNEPKNAQVLNALGYTLADRTERYEEALTYIKRAFELEPNDAAVMDSMGWVQYRLGHYNDAIEHLQKANELEEDPEIAAHFGEVLWVIGDKEKAKKIWSESLKKNPDHSILLRVIKKFTH